jgi:hypothetical protein
MDVKCLTCGRIIPAHEPCAVYGGREVYCKDCANPRDIRATMRLTKASKVR